MIQTTIVSRCGQNGLVKRLLRVSALILAAISSATSARAAEKKLEFNRDIRPILAENCFVCHGPDSASRKAGLRLDQREVAVKAKAIVPGNAEQSAAIKRIFSSDHAEMMPPPKSRKKLTAEQKETLKRWIADGAEYQTHWSFIPPKRAELPAVKNSGWVRNPIDRFILADLEKHGLQPAPEADRRTLARRLSLDLIGLPPTPAEVEEFVNDKSPDYYEKYVEKLMSSPQWGEHRGRYWLDAARYADSHGIHFDNYRENWVFREWVINAFNKNQPFDQFTLEQLAGDLLPNKTLDQHIASGFNRCNITSAEGGMIAEEYLVLYTRERTETTAAVWMGLTAGCSVCHDHKFDPISQREFYSMAAFFNNTTQAASDGNIKDTPPIIMVPRKEDRARWETIEKELAEVRKQTDARKQTARADFDKWLAQAKPDEAKKQVPTEGLAFLAPLNEGEGKELNLTVAGKARKVKLEKGLAWDAGHVSAKAFRSQPGGTLELADVGDYDKNQGFSYGAWVKIPKSPATGSIFARMDEGNEHRGWDVWIENNRVASHIINKWPSDALKVATKNPIKPEEWTHVFVTYDGSAKAAGLKIYVNGVVQQTAVQADVLKNTTKTTTPLKIAQRSTGSRIDNLGLQDLRIYSRTLTAPEVAVLAKNTRINDLLAKAKDKRTPKETDELFGWWLPSLDEPFKTLTAKVNTLQQEEAALKARGTIAPVMNEKMEPPTAFVLFRGDYDKRRDQVKASTPKILPPFPDDLPKNRLGFARWLLRPDQPLTARMTVNRFWQELFGTGIVRTSGDFGIAGELPSNQDLLDWLAVEFREGGWDMKKFFKLLVTSATYRQAAVTTPEKQDKDPFNRLLSRGPRFRMDAEMIRDYALASSGLLVRKLGGPSVKPYQPDGVWEAVAMIGSNTRDYKRDSGENLYRRSMYTFWKRAAPPASMEIFNAPNRETCAVRRERTNTPLQALVTLNDPQFVEAAKVLAEKTIKEAGDKTEARLDYMAQRILCRPLRTEETKILQSVTGELLGFYKAHPEDAKKLLAVGEAKIDPKADSTALAAWTMVANQLMNLDEVLNK